MTSNESQVSSKAPFAHLIYIYIVDDTPMLLSHKGTSSPPPPQNLFLSNTYSKVVPQFSFYWSNL